MEDGKLVFKKTGAREVRVEKRTGINREMEEEVEKNEESENK